ncbi:MAG: DUF3187 family protein [Planctomycetota bacterium]
MARGLLALLALLPLSPGCAPLNRSAPLAARNTHPVQLTAFEPAPRAARVTPEGEARASVRHQITSLWKQPGSDRDAVALDGEVYRLELGGRVGLGHGLDLDVTVPLLHASGGFLDGAIETWHRTFGLPQSSRTRFPEDRYAVRAVRQQPDGSRRTAYELEQNGVHVGDIPITLTWVPIEDTASTGFSAGLRGGVELPTGREDDGFGNGALDAGLGLITSYVFSTWALHAWASHSWVPTAKSARRTGSHYPGVTSAGFAGEAALLEELSAIVQLGYESALLEDLSADGAERDPVAIWVGGRWRPSDHLAFELGVGEDLVADIGPDVIFHFGLDLFF